MDCLIHRCYNEQLQNASIEEVRKFYSKHNGQRCMEIQSDENLEFSEVKIDPSQQKSCVKFIYDFDFLYGYRSMTSDLNWVCDNAWKSVMGQSTYFIGSVVGTLILGILADVIGRLPVLIIAHLFGILGNVLTIFASNEITFAICRFISGIATDSNFVMMYLLVLEYISPRMRTFGLNLSIGVFYCLGSVITPWLAVLLGNWRYYLIATILPALIVPFFYFIIPESAQWLIAKRKLDKALVCYQRIAKFNGGGL
jgi:MFS transporter, OCT family, solute carrier family 22 (organic cation transporter), member 4/5